MRRIRALAPLAAVLAASVLGPGVDAQDLVRLKSGKKVEGRVVFEDTERLVIRKKSRDTELEQDQIESIRSLERSNSLLLRQFRQVDDSDIAGMRDMARYAHDAGLEGMAKLLWWRLLLFEPSDDEAHEALDGRRTRGGWQLRHERRWYKLAELRRITSQWTKRWEFETLHFKLSTNLPLETACDLALDLEHLYDGFYEFPGRELELYHVTEKMLVQVHADTQSFPESPAGQRSYFSGDINTMFVNATARGWYGATAHEVAHQIVHNTAVRTRKGRGAIPAWVDEGLAEYFRASLQGKAGHKRVEQGWKDMGSFLLFSRESDPYGLKRVLNFGTGDFFASTGQQLKYAQSYALVMFLLEGDNGRWREPFLDFLRGAYEGRASSTDFEDAIGVRIKELEPLWLAYVDQMSRRR